MTDSRKRETKNTCLTTNSTAETVNQCGKDNHNHHPYKSPQTMTIKALKLTLGHR